MTHRYDAVVVGAGVIGAAVARELATDHDVLVVDRGQVAGGATGKASGIVSLQVHYEHAPEAVEHAHDFIEAYDGHRNVEFTPRPRVKLARADQRADARAYADLLQSRGFDATYLDGDAVEERFPGVFDRSANAGAVVAERMGWLDPHTFTTALVRDAEDRGADLRTGVTVESLAVDGGDVVGVETGEGAVAADTVVAAAGWRTRPLLEGVLSLPVRPERYQTVTLDVDRDLDENFPMGGASDPGHYWRPERGGQLHVGGGTHVVDPPGAVRSSADEAFVQSVASSMPDRIVGIDDARVASTGVCPTGDAVTPDRYPIVDAPEAAPDGLLVATGFSGFGVMAAPIAGTLAGRLARGESPPFPVEHFRLDRFADRSADFRPTAEPPFVAQTPASLE
jgi:glycine/D-amino acid oxidase-like deaminating enzyme